MTNRCFSVLCLALGLATTTAFAVDDVYNLDPAHTTVGFAVRHLVINTVHGRFKELTGSVQLDPQNSNAITQASTTIQTKSVDTGIDKRDDDLRSPNFFDVAKYPTIRFTSKRVETQGDQTVVVGELSMHGVTHEIALPCKVNGPIKDPWGNTRIGLEAQTTLSRKDYGLTYSKTLETGGLVVGDEVTIQINAEAVKARK